jgi:hypothetical protein
VWAGPDSSQTADQITANGEHSAIYWLKLGQNIQDESGNIRKDAIQTFLPGTYVHEPLYNGKYFAWIDTNYAPNSNLYISEPNGTPKKIDTGITTYGLGDDVLIYGKSGQIWVYVISTGEKCCMSEHGMMPVVSGNTVVWADNSSSDSGNDVLKFKALTDEELALYTGNSGTN